MKQQLSRKPGHCRREIKKKKFTTKNTKSTKGKKERGREGEKGHRFFLSLHLLLSPSPPLRALHFYVVFIGLNSTAHENLTNS